MNFTGRRINGQLMRHNVELGNIALEVLNSQEHLDELNSINSEDELKDANTEDVEQHTFMSVIESEDEEMNGETSDIRVKYITGNYVL